MRYRGLFRYRRPEDYDVPYCPMCGEDCTIYYKRCGEIVGCDMCLDDVDAWEEKENDETL